jgi:hypothetical protein
MCTSVTVRLLWPDRQDLSSGSIGGGYEADQSAGIVPAGTWYPVRYG